MPGMLSPGDEAPPLVLEDQRSTIDERGVPVEAWPERSPEDLLKALAAR